jgi:hypothetical protein
VIAEGVEVPPNTPEPTEWTRAFGSFETTF